jgi:hypothetical protein
MGENYLSIYDNKSIVQFVLEESASEYEDHFYESLEVEIIEHGFKVLIIDNLTYLSEK